MTSAPDLTDRAALLRNRLRASGDPALFLHEDVADNIQQRLSEVNKAFTSPAVVTGFPGVWTARMPQARIAPDDDLLALKPQAHDLIIHMLALHWAGDPVGQLVQCRRALRPDGLFIGALFGGATLHELRTCLAGAEAELSGGMSARVAPMADVRALGGLLQRAGFAMPVADAGTRTVLYGDFFGLLHDLRAMGEGNALQARRRRATGRALFARAGARYEAAFARPDGRLPATFEVITLTGWATAAGQPRPLRPGSAVARLADAVGGREFSPGGS